MQSHATPRRATLSSAQLTAVLPKVNGIDKCGAKFSATLLTLIEDLRCLGASS